MSATALGDVPLDARSHFQVRCHGAVLLLVDQLRCTGRRPDLAAVIRRYPFLAGYLDAAMSFVPAERSWGELHQWWVAAVADWEADRVDDLPLSRLESRLGLSPMATAQLLVAGLVDEDSRFGAVFAQLNGGLGRRPTTETLAAVTAPLAVDRGADPVAVLACSLQDGVLTASGTDAPRSEWLVQPVPGLWEAVRGDVPPGTAYAARATLPDLDALVTTAGFAEQCRRVSAGLPELGLVVVRGAAGSDRMAFAEGMCRAAGHGVLRVEVGERGSAGAVPVPGVVGVAMGAVPVVVADPMPGDSLRLARDAYRGPVVAVLGPTGGVEAEGGPVVSLDVPRLAAADRARRWLVAVADPCPHLPQIAAASGLQGRHIDVVARSAAALAEVGGAECLTVAHVRAAAADLHRSLLDDLTDRLAVAGGWEDVVVGDFTGARLLELETRCRHREQLGEALPAAYARGTGVGVRALFTGASGTGKTLAATVLGHRLGLDVHRLDLAAVVDKYIGETEKNLHRVLSAAEELDVVLLVDEGDTLLGRRTEVRSANDRFANLETNYLLQRLEHYRGIVVVTTNAPEHVDVAFQRRMDVVVSFQPPSARERAEIWRLHLPEEHRVSEQHLVDLSQRCSMTGGQIRNAVLHAVLLALREERPVDDADLERAVASEYQKAGASSPYDPSGRRQTTSHARVFQDVVS